MATRKMTTEERDAALWKQQQEFLPEKELAYIRAQREAQAAQVVRAAEAKIEEPATEESPDNVVDLELRRRKAS